MPISFILLYIVIIIAAGIVAICFTNNTKVQKNSAAVIFLASLAALVCLLWNFRSIGTDVTSTIMNWQLPFASLQLGIDSLSAFFLVPLLLLTISSSLYGPHYFGKHNAGRMHWFFFSLLITGMVLVLCARNMVLFILAWEIMSLSSFFLVITDTKKKETIRAGWIYFITAHVGTAFLLVLFFMFSSLSGSFNFTVWHGIHMSIPKADAAFVLALCAFGLKAGFIPFHVWLPLAHPAAPSHVSALMSGIMIKMGIYGIVRILTFIMPFHAWWGILLIALGSISGILGVLFAIGQHDIKRLLAYHSVENIGIILLGIGIGMTGATFGYTTIALFGFAGGLLHIVNHSIFKSLLFLGAGAVIRQTGSGEIDRLGGLIKPMPRTGVMFLIGAAAICGLPFFNGFISELLIYIASISGAVHSTSTILSMASLIVVLSLALIGGLAAACFTKVFGIVFLGEPRGATPKVVSDVPTTMLWAMGILAAACIVIGMCSVLVYPLVVRPAIMLTGPVAMSDTHALFSLTKTTSIILGMVVLLMIVIGGCIKLLQRKKQAVADVVTWDCGYSKPASSMQYTASSFASPIVRYFKLPLAARGKLQTDKELFPIKSWSFHSDVDDWYLTRIYEPLIRFCDRALSSLRWFQNGKTGQYVLYIAITVVCLIVWKFFL